jgi:hypothetical protein
MKYLVLMAALLSLCGCGANSLISRQEATVLVSTVYDGVACQQLLRERDELVQQAGVATDARVTFSSISTGFGIIIPDFRSETRRKRDAAVGKIMAMNDSLMRRCGAEKSE